MRIKTLKPDLVIGDRCHAEGDKVTVDDHFGRRLVDAGVAVRLIEDIAPPKRAEPSMDDAETAMLPAASKRRRGGMTAHAD